MPGFSAEWSRNLYIASLPVDTGPLTRGEIVDVTLAQELLLTRELTIPIAAKSDLSKAVDVNMRQSLPENGTGLAWRYRIEKHEKSSLRVVIYLIKKKTLEQIENVIAAKHGKVRTISVTVACEPLLFSDYRRHVDRSRRLWDVVAASLFVGSVLLVLWRGFTETTTLRNDIALLEQMKNELSANAIVLRQQLEEETSFQTGVIQDVDLFVSEHQRLSIIFDLTEILDQETWISELIISGSRVSFSGFTGSEATDVMEKISSLPWVERVDLAGPVTFDSYSRKNRFDLAAVIEKPRRHASE
ncbi:PilN domain-containing protein [Ruegeria atlantica]|uniref:PilN domain-containing protein n=1 Tax=Ruegeria atlantica TaxID=81569 RepID=UPI00147E11C2|nr:PilN domain-containing protein [Ruegeria atlantica]